MDVAKEMSRPQMQLDTGAGKREGGGMLGTHPAWRRNIKRWAEGAMAGLFFLCGLLAVVFVLAVTLYLVLAGLPALRTIGLRDFLLGQTWASTSKSDPRFGILPFLLTSLFSTLGAVALGVPVGVLTAVAIAKLLPRRRAEGLRTAVELLAGIPSVVYGLVGMTILVPAIRRGFHLASGATLLAAMVVLAVMVLPSIVSVAENALRAVPKEYEEASLALGATETETWFRVSLPAAGSGIAAGVVLGIGRAVGEATAILMVSGNVANMPGLLRPVRSLTAAIASEMSYASYGSLQRQALFSIALVLFLFILAINALLHVLRRGGGGHG